MMQAMMPIVHLSRPISEHSWEIGSGGYPKREVYIRPFIFAGIGGGACDGGAIDPPVIPSEFQAGEYDLREYT